MYIALFDLYGQIVRSENESILFFSGNTTQLNDPSINPEKYCLLINPPFIQPINGIYNLSKMIISFFPGTYVQLIVDASGVQLLPHQFLSELSNEILSLINANKFTFNMS